METGQPAVAFVGVCRVCMDYVVSLSKSELQALGHGAGRHRALCAGEMDALLARLQGRGQWLAGGAIANTLARLAQQVGARVGLLGRHGHDPEARLALQDMRQRGIAHRSTPSLSGRTERCIVVVDPEDGERTFLFEPGIADAILVSDVLRASGVMAGASFVLVELPFWGEAQAPVEALLRSHLPGATWVSSLHGYGHDCPPVERVLQAQVLVGNEEELGAFALALGHGTWEGLLAAYPAKLWACTQGRQGVLVQQGGRRTLVRAPQAKAAVLDTTGAGDAWLAGFLWGLSQGQGPVAAAGVGGEWALQVLTVLGGRLPMGQV